MDRATGIGLSALMEACLSVDKPNGTIGPLILAEVIDMAPRRLPPGTKAAATASSPASPSAVPPPPTYASMAAAGLPPGPPSQEKSRKKCVRTMATEEESKDKEFLDHDGEKRREWDLTIEITQKVFGRAECRLLPLARFCLSDT